MPDGSLLTLTQNEIQMDGAAPVSYGSYPFTSPVFQFKNDPTGQLWGKEQHHVIRNMETGAPIFLENAEGEPLPFSRYAFAADGSLWCAAGQSMFHRTGEGLTVYDPADSSFPEIYGQELYPGLSGSEVWITTYEDGLYRFVDGEWHLQDHPAFETLYISDIAVVPGGIWAILVGGGEVTVAFWDGSELTTLGQGDQGFEEVPLSDLVYDPSTGRLWGLGYSSLQYLEGGTWHNYDLPFTPSEEGLFRQVIIEGRRKVIWDNEQVAVEGEGDWVLYNTINSPMDNHRLTAAGLDANSALWLSHGNRALLERVQLGMVTSTEQKPEVAAGVLRVIGNPVRNGHLMVEAPASLSPAAQLRVFDPSGQLQVVDSQFSGSFAEINVEAFTAGWYLAVIVDAGKRYVAPFVVVR